MSVCNFSSHSIRCETFPPYFSFVLAMSAQYDLSIKLWCPFLQANTWQDIESVFCSCLSKINMHSMNYILIWETFIENLLDAQTTDKILPKLQEGIQNLSISLNYLNARHTKVHSDVMPYLRNFFLGKIKLYIFTES
uniref:Uncharacterized protein n=1 Tax=Micrurus lemniscatus lemniscatus TaxID=129467 RepID=A0A2D4HHH7_MICLE